MYMHVQPKSIPITIQSESIAIRSRNDSQSRSIAIPTEPIRFQSQCHPNRLRSHSKHNRHFLFFVFCLAMFLVTKLFSPGMLFFDIVGSVLFRICLLSKVALKALFSESLLLRRYVFCQFFAGHFCFCG